MFGMKNAMVAYPLGALIGALVGVGGFFIQPVFWQGQAIVKVGQFIQVQASTGSQTLIEPIATVSERVKSAGFLADVAKKANRVEFADILDVDKGTAKLNIKPLKNSDAVIISVNGKSAPDVQLMIDSIVDVLRSRHDYIISGYRSDICEELSKLDHEIALLEKSTDRLNSTDAKLSAMMVRPGLDHRLNRASMLRESISSAYIRPTSLVEPTSVLKKTFFSSLPRISVVGMMIGLILSFVWLRWRK